MVPGPRNRLLFRCDAALVRPALVALLVLSSVSGLGGCRQKTPAPVPVAPAASTQREHEPPKVIPAMPVTEASAPQPSQDPRPDPVAVVAAAPASQPDSKPPAEAAGDVDGSPAGSAAERPSRERLLFLLKDGPLVTDLELLIDGKPHTEALSAVVEQALAWCDTDGDGKPTWTEAANSPRFLYGQVGNSPTREPGAPQRMITLYDVNRNGLVDRDELPRFLTRNAGKARPFTWSTSNEYHDTNRAQSAVRRWLDEDGDGLLDTDEIAQAPARLRLRDVDGDDVLTGAEMRDTISDEPDRLSNRRQTSAPDLVLWIGPQADWAAVHYAFRERYAGGGELRRGAATLTDELFTQLDTNSDGRLEADEMSSCGTLSADLVLVVRCGKPPEADGAPPLEVDIESARLARLHPKTRFANRFALECPTATLEFFVNDQLAQQDARAQALGLLARYDENNNGYLEADEFPQQELGMQLPLAAVDENGDEKVFIEELVAFLGQRDAAARSQIRGRAADHPDALFTALDADGDGHLKTREIESSPERMRKLDQDRDGQLRTSEIPASLVVGFVRGNPQQEAALFVAPPAAVLQADRSTPRWFNSMDGNGDGEISPLEFLGPPEIFQRLDADQDHFLTPDEIPTDDEQSEKRSSSPQSPASTQGSP